MPTELQDLADKIETLQKGQLQINDRMDRITTCFGEILSFMRTANRFTKKFVPDLEISPELLTIYDAEWAAIRQEERQKNPY